MHNKHDNWNEWALDLDATEHFNLNATGVYDSYVTASRGTTVKIAEDTQEEVNGSGKLDPPVKQPEETVKTTTLHRVARVPNLRRNLLPAKQAAETSGKEVRIQADKA